MEQLAITRPKDIHQIDVKVIKMMNSSESYNTLAAQLLMKLAVDEVSRYMSVTVHSLFAIFTVFNLYSFEERLD